MILLKRTAILLFILVFPLAFITAGGQKEKTENQDKAPVEMQEEDTGTQEDASSEEGEDSQEEEQKDTTPIDFSSSEYAAMVNGVPISKQTLNQQVEMVKAQYGNAGRPLDDDKIVQVRKELLDQLIGRELILQKSQELGITVPQDQVDAQYSNVRSQFQSEEEFKVALAAQNMTEESYKEYIKEQIRLETVVNEVVASKITITAEEKSSFYQANPGQFQQPESVRASHILIGVAADATEEEKQAAKVKLQEIRERAVAGEDFAELAKQYSTGPSGSSGGDLNYFSKGQMVPSFEQAAFALEVGDISGLVETQFGYHIIKLTDRKSSGTVSFEEAEQQIAAYLQQQKLQTAMQAYLGELRMAADVTIY